MKYEGITITRFEIACIVIGIVSALVALWSHYYLSGVPEQTPSPMQLNTASATSTSRGSPTLPPFSSSTAQKLSRSTGFQLLVSYTDRGFEPHDATIKAGQTVRFTNNSSGAMWVISTPESGALYPAGVDSCGSSAFDSCLPAINSHDFWEFTFTKKGTWSYQNSVTPSMKGIIRVE